MKSNEMALQELLVKDFDGVWGDDAATGNGVPVLRSTDMRGGRLSFDEVALRSIPLNASRKKRLISGDILVNKSSGSAHLVGKSVIFFPPDGNDYYCSNFIRCLRPNKSIVDCEFLYYALQSPDFRLQVFGAQRTTSGLRNLKINEFKSGTITVPDSLDEQRRIVARIKECMERVEEIEGLRSDGQDEAKQFLRSYYHDLYEDLLAVHPTQPLGDLGRAIGGGTPSKKRADFWDGDIPWVSPKEMKRRDISETNLFITTAAVEGSSVRLIEEPSVMFVVRGMILAHTLPVAVNRVALTMNQDMKAITPNDGILVDYLATMVRGAERRLLGKIEVAGHGTRRLQTEHWSSLPIPILNNEEQLALISKVQEVEAAADALLGDVTSDEVSQLSDSILRKAFSGEL